jgi:hypothetical protein
VYRPAEQLSLAIVLFITVMGVPTQVCAQDELGLGSQETVQMTAEPRFDEVPQEKYLSDTPPVLSEETLQHLLEAQQRTHLPTPPLPVGPASDPDEVIPGPESEPPTQSDEPIQSDPKPLASGDFVLFRNQDLGSGAPTNYTSMVGEPSVGANGDVVFQTGNWYTALSTDAGQSFSFVNPFAGPFSSVNGGFCCDQIAIYDPSRDAMFYLQQYITDGTTGTQRVNVDMGGDGSFDCAYDFTPQSSFGRPQGEWLDFPDLVLGANYLYHTSNIFDQSDSFTASVIARYPLDTMGNCQSISYNYWSSTTQGSPRATHGAGTTMYWGAHNSTSSIRLFRWDESSGTVYWDDRTINTWYDSTRTCPGPDGKDWCGRASNRILGAYVADGVIGFMWSSSQGGSYPYPYIQIARFDESTRTLIDQPKIWSSDAAFIYPSVGVNAREHLAGTMFFGGGSSYPSCAAWIADDINSGTLQPAELITVVGSDSGPDQNKSGDYLASRPHFPYTNTWVGTCFSLQGGGANSNARPRFAWFGRERDTPSSGDDDYEENDTQATAYDLASFEQQWLSTISGYGIQADDDWYQIYVSSGYERVQVDLDFVHSEGDIDLGLYDAAGSSLASSTSVTDDEAIDYVVSQGGTYYYLKVYYANAGNTYNLWWDDLAPPDTTDPTISITSPTSSSTYTTSSSTITIGGTASDNVGVTQVTWSNNRGGSGTASGTTSWSKSGITLYSGTNVLTVTAHDAAANTGSDTLTVTYNPLDTTDPTISITSPTSSSTYTTSSSTITIGGTASDNVGVTQVTWSNNRGGSGTASGTTSWSKSGITLYSGTNVLTVMAHDAAANTGSDTLTVTYESDVVCYPSSYAEIGPITFQGTKLYQGQGTLATKDEVVVPSGAAVTFEAATGIVLNPGFRVEGTFQARIAAVTCGT